jgi:hypothetical protein
MHRAHLAGERLFGDYAGQTVDLSDDRTGEIRPAQIFVAAMGASNDTYAEARLTHCLLDSGRRAYPGARLQGRRAGAADARSTIRAGRSIATTGTRPASTAPTSISRRITTPRSGRRPPGASVQGQGRT